MRTHWSGLLGVVIIFLVVRVPLCLSRPGRTDEDWFSAPGWTVAYEGGPRIPYAPSRDPQGYFYRADEMLFALPPAYFYWQAPWYYVFPGSYGTARLASLSAGVLSLILAFWLGVKLLGDPAASLLGVALYSWSRVFFIPATTVRPDILCSALGLGALLALAHWQQDRRTGWLCLSGALLGLGGLTHPFAIVYSLQAGVWVLLSPTAFAKAAGGDDGVSRALRVSGRLAVLLLCAASVSSLWLILIVRDPDLFWTQFGNNVLYRHETALLNRLIWPWPSLGAQFGSLLLRIGPIQLAMMALGTAAVAWSGIRRRSPAGPGGPGRLAALTISAAVLLVLLAGTHLTSGHWCYPGALVWLCCGWALTDARERLRHLGGGDGMQWASRRLPACLPPVLLLLLLPGSQARLWWRQVTHWNAAAYQSRQIVRDILDDLPPRAELLADRSFVFDVFAAGRRVTLGENGKRFFEAEGRPFDFLIINPDESRDELPVQLDAVFWRSYGDCSDPFAICAEVYVGRSSPAGDEGHVVEP